MTETDMKDQIAMALAKAQMQMTNATLNKTNPHFKSKYADLSSVREATLKALNDNDIALTQFTSVRVEGDVFLHTMLLHKSGQSIVSVYPLHGETAQKMGSDMTYARRYSWAALCAITAEEDDDGNLSSYGGEKRKSAHQARKEGEYERLQKEIRAVTSLEDLQALWRDNASVIFQLPPQWKELITEEKDRRKTELAVGEKIDPETGEIKPAINPDPQAPHDADRFLDLLDSDLASCKDVGALNECVEQYEAGIAKLAPHDQKVADKAIAKHTKRLGVK